MAKILTIKKAQSELPSMLKNSKKKKAKYIITDKGVAYFLDIAPIEEGYNSESETSEILANKQALRDIKIAEKELAEGKYVTLEQLKRELNI